MGDDAVSSQAKHRRIALAVAGVVLGALGDALLRAPDPPHLNLSLWIAAVGSAAIVLHRYAAVPLDRTRIAWLVLGVVFGAGLAWRDSPALWVLALGCASLAFALAAHRLTASWIRHAGITRYAGALALGAAHAWTAAALAIADVVRVLPRAEAGRAGRWSGATSVARGAVLAVPFVAVFGALFMSADAVFEQLVVNAVRIDVGWLAGHVALFTVSAWLATGYLRGFETGTDIPLLGAVAPSRPELGMTEAVTVLAALVVLFAAFVIVQVRYLFGGDALVQVTPGLTYADYARRGFFELVFAALLVMPVLLVADWLVERRTPRDERLFRALTNVQVALVLAVAASAFQRLRLYHATYGLTEARFYAMVLLIWIGAMLAWLAATALRGRRDAFGFGALASGFAVVALLFLINPDDIIARTNLARISSASAPVRFDVTYATTLSGDAVPVLIEALPDLPPDVQCPLARRMLHGWPSDRIETLRSWNWSARRAAGAVRAHEAELRSMLGAGQSCPMDRVTPLP